MLLQKLTLASSVTGVGRLADALLGVVKWRAGEDGVTGKGKPPTTWSRSRISALSRGFIAGVGAPTASSGQGLLGRWFEPVWSPENETIKFDAVFSACGRSPVSFVAPRPYSFAPPPLLGAEDIGVVGAFSAVSPSSATPSVFVAASLVSETTAVGDGRP